MSFSEKVLQIPSLEEVGVPMAGYGRCRLHEALRGAGSGPCWIDRGAPLLEYEFRLFSHDQRPLFAALFGDPVWKETFEITSPIAGLLLDLRDELTVADTIGLQYESDKDALLPVLLVPEDEPPPEPDNFAVYDRIARCLQTHFWMIPIRDRSRSSPERLRDYLARYGDEAGLYLRQALGLLDQREHSSYRSYDIRELSAADRWLIRRVQDLRSKDGELREKLVHIARKYGESI